MKCWSILMKSHWHLIKRRYVKPLRSVIRPFSAYHRYPKKLMIAKQGEIRQIIERLTVNLSACTLVLAYPDCKAEPQYSKQMERTDQRGSEISELLAAWNEGDLDAWNVLIPIVYDELRQQAHRQLLRERQNHTLHTTALVHETYLKLAGQRFANFENRAHFFWLASEIMRRVLVDYARIRKSDKRGGEVEIFSIDSTFQIAIDNSEVDLLALDDALTKLAKMDPQQAKIVEVRYFGGCSIEETAKVVGTSVTTVKRDWASAKAWLAYELTPVQKK